MSTINVKAFFRFCKVKVIKQVVDTAKRVVKIEVRPDRRYSPVCHKCKEKVKKIHSWNQRVVRDLNIFDAKSFIRVTYRTIQCPVCGNVIEDLGLMDPYMRVTRRLANYIIGLCKVMSIKEVACHLDLNWKTVKEIHKKYLKDKFEKEHIGNPRFLAIDEISIKKGHKYLTVIVNWENGKVLWIGEGRGYESVKVFFKSLTQDQIESIEAIVMDMWDPYIKAVKEYCPEALIVFDQFHVISAFNRVIDSVRNDEYRKATREGKEVLKGSKYLLLKNRENLHRKEKQRLEEILRVNKAITSVYVLKDYLKKLYQYRYPKSAQRMLRFWYHLAMESGLKPVMAFAKTLARYAYGIINHCRFPLHTSILEGINNKIKLIKRRAYGFHDLEYFSLIIKDAFSNTN